MLINKNDKIFIAGHNGLVGKAIKKSLQKKIITKTYYLKTEKFRSIKF